MFHPLVNLFLCFYDYLEKENVNVKCYLDTEMFKTLNLVIVVFFD